MRRIISLGLISGLLVAAPALCGAISHADRSPVIDVLSSDDRAMSVIVEIPELSMRDLTLEGLTFQEVEIPGGGFIGREGEPAIPVLSRFLVVPEGVEVRLSSTRLEVEQMDDVRLMPAQPVRENGDDRFSYHASAYEAIREDDGVDVTLGEPGMVRGFRLVPLVFRPVRYDPATRTMTVTKRMRVDVEFELIGPSKTMSTGRTIPPSFDSYLRATVLNYEDYAASMTVAPGTVLIISTGTTAIVDTLQQLIEWRERKGYPVIHETAAGGTSNQIKTYIQGVYDTPGTELEYVVLVGDAGTIPTWYESLSGYGGEGDFPYSQLEGSDVLADVHLGRLSYGTTAELGIIVGKIVKYEKAPMISDPSWFLRGQVTGDPSYSGWSCVEAGRWTKENAFEIGYAEVDSAFSSSYVSKMLTALNRGDTFFGYRGYLGMSGWNNGYTNTLSNGWRLPFAVIITCDSGSFAADASARSEGFLRAGTWDTTTNPDTVIARGALGCIGMATLGTHTRYNNSLYYGCFQGLLVDDLGTMGACLTRGQMEVYLSYQSNDPTTVNIWSHWCNLMGDPAAAIYTAYPAAMDVAHETSVAVAENGFEVTVTSSSVPVENALVCLSKGTQTYVVGYTGTDGAIDLPLANTSSGTMLLTVTKQNMYPYLADITVSGTDHVGYAASTVDDDGSGGSSGNGDGAVNPNETVELGVQVENFSGSTVNSVTGTLTSSDPFVTITDGVESFGDIGAGGTAWSVEDFDFVVDGGCPDEHLIQFDLDLSSGSGDFHSLLEFTVVSAELVYQDRTYYDDGGNGFDPGETVGLSVELRNDGSVAAGSPTATLYSLTPYISVGDALGDYATIEVGGSAENTGNHFSLTAASNTFEGYSASLVLVAEFDGGRVDSVPVTLNIGSRSSNDPAGPDDYGYWAFENTDAGYDDSPVYSWVEIDPAYGGSGTATPIYDGGGYQDDSYVMALPFPFRYYGVEYDTVTICSNGWLSMGRSSSNSYRNWSIPGAGGPGAMLAVFWDNLYMNSGSDVLTWNDTANHRFIVEWSRCLNDYGGAEETFQIILNDPAYHQTDSGDGEIIYQYETVTVTDPTNGYVTVGIENLEQTDGVLVTYFNRNTAGSAAITAGRAIKFVPVFSTVFGTVQGMITNRSYGDAPVPGVQIEVVGTGKTFSTGGDGTYTGLITPGTYDLVTSVAGFAPDTALAVEVIENQTTVQDFSLTDIAGPIVVTTPHGDTEDVTGPYTIPVSIEEHSGLPVRTLYYRTNWNGTPVAVALDSVGPGEFEGDIPGMPYTTIVEYWVFARDGIGYETLDPAGAPDDVYRFIVSSIDVLVDEDFETNQGWTVGDAGDGATTGIWVREDPVGTEYNSQPVQPEDDYSPSPGVICFVTGNGAVGGSAGDQDVDGGKTTLVSPVFDLSGYGFVTLSYAVWYTNNRGSNPGGDQWLVTVNDGLTTVNLENTTSSTNAWVVRNFDLDQMITLTSDVQFKFVASDDASGSLVEAAVDEFVLTGSADVATAVGSEPAPRTFAYGIDRCRPNPFNPQTTLGYRMKERGRARIRIFDLSGRHVRTLIDDVVGAGSHDVQWNGKSDSGRDVTSGIYFVRFEATGFMQVRQITLVR